MTDDLKYWIAISQFAKIGAARFKKLYNYFPDMETAWQAGFLELQKSGLEPNIASEFVIVRKDINPDQELAKVKEEGIEAITVRDENYSKLLKEVITKKYFR